jgi:VanZ family protein
MNLKAILPYIRRYPLSLICIVVIWYLCIWFLPPDFPELHNVKFIDKWTHFVMYGGFCSVIWWEYLRSHDRISMPRLLLLAWLAPIAMSGCIELAQAYCTTNRSGEWLDLAANATGCTLGIVSGLVMKKVLLIGPPHKGGC